jgi:protein transport protein SEC31
MKRVKAKAPPQFKPQVLDTEKRLNILFDHLNNEDLLKPETVTEVKELAEALGAGRHDDAGALCTDMLANKAEEGSNWMVSAIHISGCVRDALLTWRYRLGSSG